MIGTWFYIDYLLRNLFLHAYIFVDLRSGSPPYYSLDSTTHEGITFLRVGEVLHAGDFKFPILLANRYDEESIVCERGPGSGLGRCCQLCRSYKLRSEMK